MRDDAGMEVDRAMLRQVPDAAATCVRPRGLLRGLLRGVLQRHALRVVLIRLVHSRRRHGGVRGSRFGPLTMGASARSAALAALRASGVK